MYFGFDQNNFQTYLRSYEKNHSQTFSTGYTFIRITNFIKGWHGGVAPLEVSNVVFKVDLTVYGFYNPVRRVNV